MTLAKISCATDFSDGANAALRVAAQLAREQNAELVVTHAWSLPAAAYLQGYAFSPDVIDRATTEAQRGLDDAVSIARAAGVTQISTALLTGSPWRAITETIASDPRIDLVVIGTRGRPSSARSLFGSVVTQVVRHARCSVLVVRPENRPAPFEHVLCAVDLSEGARHAFKLAARLAQNGRSGITLVHVVETPVAYPSSTTSYLADVQRLASAELERWAAELRDLVTVRVSTLLLVGNAGDELLSTIDRDPSIDLVITGSHGRSGLERILLGSVAEKIVRHARTPVLIARTHATDG